MTEENMKCDLVYNCLTKLTDFKLISQSICIIRVSTYVFDWQNPENKSFNSAGSGTGFVVDPSAFSRAETSYKRADTRPMPSIDDEPVDNELDTTYIITAHHVVANAVQIRVHFAKASDEFVPATLIGSNPELDMAVIGVKHAKLRKLGGLSIGDSDAIAAPYSVNACGFAQGRMHIQTTKGVISGRICNPSRIQMDNALNPGNSGGPVLNEKGEVIGIVCSGQVKAQGINYGAPINEVMVCADRIVRHQPYAENRGVTHVHAYHDRLPSLNCKFVRGNPQYFNAMGAVSGIVCVSVHPNIQCCQADEAPAHVRDRCTPLMTKRAWRRLLKGHKTPFEYERDTIRKGDLLTSMTIRDRVFDIDAQMSVACEFWSERVPYMALFDRLEPDETIVLHVVRSGEKRDILFSMRPLMSRFREYYPEIEFIPYVTRGGITVMTLTHNHIHKMNSTDLVHIVNTPEKSHVSALLITCISPESPFNSCDGMQKGDIIVRVNDTPVETVEEYEMAWQEALQNDSGGVIMLHMRDGNFATAPIAKVANVGGSMLRPT